MKFFWLSLALVFAASCDYDQFESPQMDPSLARAKTWFEASNSGEFKYKGSTGQLNWSKSFIWTNLNGKEVVELPIEFSGRTFSLSENEKGGANIRLIILKSSRSREAVVLNLIPNPEFGPVFQSGLGKKSIKETLKYFSGLALFYKWQEDQPFTSYQLLSGRVWSEAQDHLQANLRVDCETITNYEFTEVCTAYSCTTYLDAVSTSTFCIFTPDTIQNARDQSLDPSDLYGGGPSGSDPSVEDTQDGIDCASFVFRETTSNWQESAVRSVGFNVVYFDPTTGVKITREFKIDRAIWFGVPKERYDHQEISPGKPAELAASAVQFASDLTFAL